MATSKSKSTREAIQRAAPKPKGPVLSFSSPESSNVTMSSYDPDTKQLIVTFHHGRSYAYFAVPLTVWEDFLAADSKGSFFATHVKGVYACQIL